MNTPRAPSASDRHRPGSTRGPSPVAGASRPRGRAVGLYYPLRNLSIVPASILGGLWWRTAGPGAMFYAAFAAAVAGFLFYAAWGTRRGRQ